MKLLTKGKPVVDSEGFPVKDEAGNPIHRPPSAADLGVIRARLKDCGITTGKRKNARNVASIMSQLRLQRPPDDDDDYDGDDAA